MEHDGTTHEDIETMSRWTPYTLHSHKSTAPAIAEGLHACILEGAKQQGFYADERQHLRGLTVLLQGLNETGTELLEKLIEEGARIIATDNDQGTRSYAHFMYRFRNVTVAEPARNNTDRNWFWKCEGYNREAHIAIACGPSLTWNDETLRAFTGTPIKLATGSAWHQYSEEEPTRQSRDWKQAGILTLPDIITTGGGIIATTPTLPGRLRIDEEETLRRARTLGTTLEQVIEQARSNKTTPWEETVREAERKLQETGKEKRRTEEETR